MHAICTQHTFAIHKGSTYYYITHASLQLYTKHKSQTIHSTTDCTQCMLSVLNTLLQSIKAQHTTTSHMHHCTCTQSTKHKPTTKPLIVLTARYIYSTHFRIP